MIHIDQLIEMSAKCYIDYISNLLYVFCVTMLNRNYLIIFAIKLVFSLVNMLQNVQKQVSVLAKSRHCPNVKRHHRVKDITTEYVMSQVESMITPHSVSRNPGHRCYILNDYSASYNSYNSGDLEIEW